jgi:hypothetical protein
LCGGLQNVSGTYYSVVLRGTELSVDAQSPEELASLLASAALEVGDAAIVEAGLGGDELELGTG